MLLFFYVPNSSHVANPVSTSTPHQLHFIKRLCCTLGVLSAASPSQNPFHVFAHLNKPGWSCMANPDAASVQCTPVFVHYFSSQGH